MRRIAGFVGLLVMAACSSGGDSSAGDAAPPEIPASFSGMDRHATTLADHISETYRTEYRDLQRRGNLSYAGVAGFGRDTDESAMFLGQMKLDIDISRDNVSGRIDNFRDANNGPVRGRVDMAGVMSRDGVYSVIEGGLDGFIRLDDRPRDVGGAFVGTLTGARGENAVGAMTAQFGRDIYQGYYVASR